MTDKSLRRRISAPQKSILIALFLLSQRLPGPFHVNRLREIINNDRRKNNFKELQVSNFSVSCKTLLICGYLVKYRDNTTLQVAYQLSPAGTELAQSAYDELVSSMG